MRSMSDQQQLTALSEMLQAGTTPEQALVYFDQLEPIDLHRIIGQWRGVALPTGHPIDELSTLFGWYGKLFFDPEHAHPLLFKHQEQLISIDPRWIPLSWIGRRTLPAKRVLAKMAKRAQFMVISGDSHARLRMLHYRGQLSATLVYDGSPVLVMLRQVNADTLLGVMEIKDMPQPFFCVLYRD